MSVFEGKKLSNDVIINATMSDHEVVASDVLPRYFELEILEIGHFGQIRHS